jgi:hypothetical protein
LGDLLVKPTQIVSRLTVGQPTLDSRQSPLVFNEIYFVGLIVLDNTGKIIDVGNEGFKLTVPN